VENAGGFGKGVSVYVLVGARRIVVCCVCDGEEVNVGVELDRRLWRCACERKEKVMVEGLENV